MSRSSRSAPAERLELRSRSGDVSATVPAGRYSIDAQSDTGEVQTRGLDTVQDAGFEIQALSTSGDVTRARRPDDRSAIDLSPHLRAARRALLYLIVGLGQGLTYLLVLGGGLVLGSFSRRCGSACRCWPGPRG